MSLSLSLLPCVSLKLADFKVPSERMSSHLTAGINEWGPAVGWQVAGANRTMRPVACNHLKLLSLV